MIVWAWPGIFSQFKNKLSLFLNGNNDFFPLNLLIELHKKSCLQIEVTTVTVTFINTTIIGAK